jgi:hypothetical protein
VRRTADRWLSDKDPSDKDPSDKDPSAKGRPDPAAKVPAGPAAWEHQECHQVLAVRDSPDCRFP